MHDDTAGSSISGTSEPLCGRCPYHKGRSGWQVIEHLRKALAAADRKVDELLGRR